MTSLSLDTSNSSLCSTDTSGSYDQWQAWASKQRRSSRTEQQDLIHDEVDSQTLKHFELPRKKPTKSLLDDDDSEDECCDPQSQISIANMMPRFLAARKSLLEDDSDDEEEEEPLPLPLSSYDNTCDALFLPPTALRRNDDCFAAATPRFPSSRSLLDKSFSSLSTTVTPTTLTPTKLSYSSGKTGPLASPAKDLPLSITTAMNYRRRFSVSRPDSALPVV